MQMKDLMWEMFLSTGHIGAYLLYKESTKEGVFPFFELEQEKARPQKLPVS